MTTSDPAKWELIKKIIKDTCPQNNGIFTINKIKEEFEKRHPHKNSSDVSEDIRMMPVNSQSRLSYLYIYGKPNPNKKVRNPSIKNSDSEYSRISSPKNEKDILFYLGCNEYEIYEPSKHGVWEIVLDAEDVNYFKVKGG